MTKRFVVSALLVSALACAAVPALADKPADPGANAPGLDNKPVDPGANGQANKPENPPDTGDNPGLNNANARALGRKECQEFKENFADNKNAFGKCISAIAKALGDENVSARQACNAADLSHKKQEGQEHSDFRACVLAAKQAKHAAG